MTYRDMTFCMDRKCLRHVCFRHPCNIDKEWDGPVSYSPFLDCDKRLRMKGDDDEIATMDDYFNQVAHCDSHDSGDVDWPDSVRINAIGQNGNSEQTVREHYDQ